MKIPNQIIDRFQEAVALHATHHLVEFRIANKNEAMKQLTQLVLNEIDKNIINMLELGILEYETWKKLNEPSTSQKNLNVPGVTVQPELSEET